MKIIQVDFTVADDVDTRRFAEALTKIYSGDAEDEDVEYVLDSIHSSHVNSAQFYR